MLNKYKTTVKNRHLFIYTYYVQVLEGIKVGEPVVVSANFLIDAESNLQAALGSFGAPAAEPSSAPTQPNEHASHAAGSPAMPKGQ